MSLEDIFSQLTDPRRKEGLRTSLSQVLSMVTLSYLCGYQGYRPVANFCKSQEDFLRVALGLRHNVPSHVTFREVMKRMDDKELIQSFTTWAKDYVPLKAGEWVSGDGKALGSTMENMHNKAQDFQAVVSLFCHQTGLVRLVEQYRNAKKSEIEVLRSLLAHLQGAGVIIRLDALHTQKNY